VTLGELNLLPVADAQHVLLTCCGSTKWARAMAARRPFAGFHEVEHAADTIWSRMGTEDWREAFAQHPRIGERKPESDETSRLSNNEQSRALAADEDTKRRLAQGNREYEERFGQTFIIAAAGRSAEDILAALTERMNNDAETELRIAAEEQRKITHRRLEMLLERETERR
jgi:OHCU decarboxylase